jgi:hypothetical protein
MGGVLRNATPTKTQVSSARSPGGAGWIANFDVVRKPPGTSGSQLDNKPAKISKIF